MKKIIIFIVLVLFAIANVSAQNKVANDPNAKTFPPSEKVATEKVSYYNRLGLQIVADLYYPKGLDKNQKHAAIIVGHPFGGVKEQTAGLYAQTMAERGFVAIAFDASYGGESGGEPRNMISPEAFVEDFSAAAIDPRIKAVSTVSMYDMGRDARQSINDTRSEAELRQEMANIVNRRYEEFEGSSTQYWYGSPLVPGAVHVDLYDQIQYIPFDKLEAFYKENLK